MHIVDILYSIPMLLYVILLMVVFKPGLLNIYLALGIAYWLNMARVVRGQNPQSETAGIRHGRPFLRDVDLADLAASYDSQLRRTDYRHLDLIDSGSDLYGSLFSFIGLGVSAPMASWGVLASEGINSMRSFPFQLVFPALALCITMLGFMFLGDGLRDALDPQNQEGGKSMKPLLEVRHLSISFHTYRGLLEAVHAVSLTVHAGETVGIVGESGCGKSVTSQAVMKLLPQRAAEYQSGDFMGRPRHPSLVRTRHEWSSRPRYGHDFSGPHDVFKSGPHHRCPAL